jgi:hypothetical protein
MVHDYNEEKRIRTRVDYRNQILCYKHIVPGKEGNPDPRPIRIFIQDISYSGIGIECNKDLGMGDVLFFNLETGGVIKEMMMEVKWCKYRDGVYIAGLQFINLTKESVLFLDDLIKGHIRRRASRNASMPAQRFSG